MSLKFLRHDPLRVRVVEMCEVDEGLPHVLVHVDGVRVLHELPDHLALVVLHHQHLLGLRHPADHDVSNLERSIDAFSSRQKENTKY